MLQNCSSSYVIIAPQEHEVDSFPWGIQETTFNMESDQEKMFPSNQGLYEPIT